MADNTDQLRQKLKKRNSDLEDVMDWAGTTKIGQDLRSQEPQTSGSDPNDVAKKKSKSWWQWGG